MMNVAKMSDTFEPRSERVRSRRESRFMPRDPAQVVFRELLAKLDEGQLVDLESDIEHFLTSGSMSRRVSDMIEAAALAA